MRRQMWSGPCSPPPSRGQALDSAGRDVVDSENGLKAESKVKIKPDQIVDLIGGDGVGLSQLLGELVHTPQQQHRP